MAWSLVASLSAGGPGGGGSFTTSAIDTTGADLIVVNYAEVADSTLTLTDSKGNTYTQLVHVGASAFRYDNLFYCAAPTVGSGHTFTVGPLYASVHIAAFSGSAASPADLTNSGTSGGGSTIQPGSITPSEDDCLVVTGQVTGTTTTPATINGGFTIAAQNPEVGSFYAGGGIAYLVQTAATAANPTWSGEGFWAATIASFKGGAAGPAPTPPVLRGPTRSTEVLQ